MSPEGLLKTGELMGVIIAGTSSDSGKTTITIAIMTALTRAGHNISPFKIGPDYIDTKYHQAATGNNSYNLDTYLHDAETLRYLYNKHCKEGEPAIIEGVMGLYDGLGSDETGSTALAAKILKLPVILVIDGKSLSRSAAAIALGFQSFDPGICIIGIILNNLSSEAHYQLIKSVIESATQIPCIGYLPHNADFKLHSRHLGLIPVEESIILPLEKLAAQAAATIDLDYINNSALHTAVLSAREEHRNNGLGKGLVLGVAMDKAFNFYYKDNLELLEEAGTKLVMCDFFKESCLPPGIDSLYIGGGFPEVYAAELAKNKELLADIKAKANRGLPVFAECGGLMLLTRGIHSQDNFYPMAGFFSCETVMTDRLMRFGYAELDYQGVTIRCHEFHYSRLEHLEEEKAELQYKVRKPGKELTWECGLAKKNVLAGYPHIHFYSNINFFNKILSLLSRKKNLANPQKIE